MKNTVKIIVLAFLAGFGGSYTFYHLVVKPELANNEQPADTQFSAVRYDSAVPYISSGNTSTSTVAAPAVDFSEAASKATQSVVYINSISQGVSY